MPRYLILGAGGMLGTDLIEALGDRSFTALRHEALDITDRRAVLEATAGVGAVINCAAHTMVDEAESREGEAQAINALGAENAAVGAAAAGAVLIQISTDYVFAGDASSPYAENTPAAPRTAYGRSKAEGERRALAANADTIILRTAWLYGKHGRSFPRTILELADERETLDVVTDQRGQPTWTVDLAERIVSLLDLGVRSGTFHATNAGETSWYDFGRAVFAEAGLDPDRVRPVGSDQFVRTAPRPAYSVLGHAAWTKIGLGPMRPWPEALSAASARAALR